MATQTIEQPKEFAAEYASTPAFSPLSEVLTPYVGPLTASETEDVEEAKVVAAALEMVTYAPAPIHKDRFLSRVGRQLANFYDWLSGPNVSERGHIRRAVAVARNDWTKYW